MAELTGSFTSIAATPHPWLWDRTGPVLVLGRWCEPAVKDCAGLTYAIVPYQWEDRSRIATAEAYAWDVFRWAIRELTGPLNDIHGTRHDAPYWQFLLAPWLLEAIHIVYDRYLVTREAHRIAPAAPLRIPAADVPPPATTQEALDRHYFDGSNLALFGRLFRILGHPVVDVDAGRRTPMTRPIVDGRVAAPPLVNRLARGPARLLRAWLARRSGRRVLVAVSDLDVLDAACLARHVRGLRVPPQAAAVPTAFVPSESDRKALTGIAARDEFERVFAEMLPAILPATFVERYGAIVDASERLYGRRPTPVVFTYYDEILAECAARAVEAGRAVDMYQHGAGYHQYRTYPLERIHITPGRNFVSWGHTAEDVRPLPSPRLSRLANAHRGGDRVVLVEASWPKYLYRIHSKPICQGPEMEELLVSFVGSLAPAVRATVVLKPDPEGVERNEAVRHPELIRLPQAWAGGSTRGIDWMRQSRLTVVTYPETAFVEALTMNVPTIGLWPETLFELRDSVGPTFDALREAGVVFHDAPAAARHVDAVYTQADAWWRQGTIQAVRRQFLERFGLAAADWRAAWVRYLREVADAPRGGSDH